MTNADKIPIAILAVCAIVGFVFLSYSLGDSDATLEVRTEGIWLTVKNVGYGDAKILDVEVNGRAECRPKLGQWGEYGFRSVTLKVGDGTLWISPCPIVRVTIKADSGSETYTFQ